MASHQSGYKRSEQSTVDKEQTGYTSSLLLMFLRKKSIDIQFRATSKSRRGCASSFIEILMPER
jgi:hypothetical protein